MSLGSKYTSPNVNEFLRHRGLDAASIVASVESAVGFGAADVLVAVGSLVEGIGNDKSDLDLWLVACRRRALAQADVALSLNGCVVDVKVLHSSRLAEIVRRLKAWCRKPWSVAVSSGFSGEDLTLLHRLLHSRVMSPTQSGHDVLRLRPTSDQVAKLKLHVARQMARTVQVDMAGLRDSGDYSSLVFAAQDLLGYAVDALLAAYRLTNPLAKWRNRLLESLPPDWERCLGTRPTGSTASALFWRLHRAPENCGHAEACEHALRIATFARAVFFWAELQLVRGGAGEWLGEWPHVLPHASDMVLPHFDYDVDVVRCENGVVISRLNEGGVRMKLSHREFVLARLFDGKTTTREATRVMNGNGVWKTPYVVNRLATRLAKANFTVSPIA